MNDAYAQALIDAVKGGMAPKEAVRRTVALLERTGKAKLVPGVLGALRRHAQEVQKSAHAELIVARIGDSKKARAQSQAPEDAVVSIDETIVGGWRLKNKSELVDASYKSYLKDLYNRVRA